MIRVNMIVEGHTEEAFVNQTLTPFFAKQGIYLYPRRVETGRKGGRIYRGGVNNYEKIRNDIRRWISQDPNAWLTTMFDLYALPQNFPGLNTSKTCRDPYEKVMVVENAFAEDIDYEKFIPYIQLHEFEAILLAEPMKISEYFIEERKACENLLRMVASYETPEHINDTPEGAPSKRIIHEIPSYEDLKSTAGPLISEAIGMDIIMERCKHFADWVNKIATIS